MGRLARMMPRVTKRKLVRPLKQPANDKEEAVAFDGHASHREDRGQVGTLSPELSTWRATAAATDLPGLMRALAAQLAGRTGAAALFLRRMRTEPARLETVGDRK